MRSFVTRCRQETIDLGKWFAASLKQGDVVAICGNLGSGKTQFAKGVCEGLGVRAHVTSPTFTFVNEFVAPVGDVVHIDLYRVGSAAELVELGIEEYFNQRTICLIEWAEKILNRLPQLYHLVKISHGTDEEERKIEIQQVQEAPA
ncbi:MAG: tRNA (adenosine(37)-N6)-threonylcarbamoyltransferase complex ATPase subunit type 1 TsaE [Ignavibacteria bacterium]|nr:tRNA (adenosine(37)-N6)-threonylcarbamoyltransferase complex ATPase subunit type 1 TsaE [Ignavibacteria bacterium]